MHKFFNKSGEFLKNKTIYILEDEIIIALDYKAILHEKGYANLKSFATGEELYAAAMSKMPDLIIADLVLKNEHDGVHLVERLRKKYDVPVIFISGTNLSKYKSMFDPSKTAFLSKPIKNSELTEAVQKFLEPKSKSA